MQMSRVLQCVQCKQAVHAVWASISWFSFMLWQYVRVMQLQMQLCHMLTNEPQHVSLMP